MHKRGFAFKILARYLNIFSSAQTLFASLLSSRVLCSQNKTTIIKFVQLSFLRFYTCVASTWVWLANCWLLQRILASCMHVLK